MTELRAHAESSPAAMRSPAPGRSPARHMLTARIHREVLTRTRRSWVPSLLGIKPRHNPQRERDELRAYLGDGFEQWRLADPERVVDDEFTEIGDEDLLYRTSRGYLYNLTAFAMGRAKDPYLADLESHLAPPARLLDYGCGIGSDGLCLMDAGYRVGFADFDNPSAEYLRWRLEHRGYRAPVYDLDRAHIPADFELAFAFDVIEHVADPFGLLASMESCARQVVVNLLEPLEGETTLHHELPVADILRYAADRGLQRYSVHHGRSHLITYEPAATAKPAAARRARRAAAARRALAAAARLR